VLIGAVRPKTAGKRNSKAHISAIAAAAHAKKASKTIINIETMNHLLEEK